MADAERASGAEISCASDQPTPGVARECARATLGVAGEGGGGGGSGMTLRGDDSPRDEASE